MGASVRNAPAYRPPRCKVEGCTNQSRDRQRLCKRHNGGPRCQRPLCPKGAQGKTPFCIAHGGGNRCATLGCISSAQEGGLCMKCGGGVRCSFPGCLTPSQQRVIVNEETGARDHRCSKHGAGRRCFFPDCERIAQVYSAPPFACREHGGVPKCASCHVRSVVYSFSLCRPCGGGRKCAEPTCKKNITAKKTFCRMHEFSQQTQTQFSQQVPPVSRSVVRTFASDSDSTGSSDSSDSSSLF